MIPIQRLARGVLFLIVAGAIFALLYWALGAIVLPSPFGYVANVVLVLGAVGTIIGILLWIVGVEIFKPGP